MIDFPFEVRDPIYGFIPFDDWEKQIINSPPFQRLRRIQQLALTSFIYPGAVHNRFEHSLGVMHFATLMFNHIIKNKTNLEILQDNLQYREEGLKKTKRLIRLAALLHDVGHSPFSHASEDIMPFIKKTKKRFKHENYTSAIIKGPLKDYIENNDLNNRNYNISAADVANLIDGVPSNDLFWRVLISSQLDADKGDYLLRDSHHIGVRYGIYDYNRLLNTLALSIDPETGSDVVLGVREDGWHVAESVILARYQMFTQVYFHKTRRAYDYHLLEALKFLLNNGVLPDLYHLDDYLKFDDYTIWELIKSNQNNEHCKILLQRNHFRSIYSTTEIQKDGEDLKFDKIIKLLDQNNIPYYSDKLSSLMYKSNLDLQIMIINKESNRSSPLSNYSPIVKNIGEFIQSRIYISNSHREKAKELINEK